MQEQYAPCDCEACQKQRLNLADNPKKKAQFKKLLNIGEKAFKKLFDKKGYKPEDLFKNSEYQALANGTAELFNTAIPHHTPEDLKAYLEQDIFIFSQLKTHTQLTEARQYLKDDKGNIRSYHDFEQNVLKLNKRYNLNYLEAEYEFATHSAMSASNWGSLQEDTGRYWLEYRTAGDDRVRDEHRALSGICLPKDDPFWSEFYPPNGWRCRCVATEVLAKDKTKSDSKKAIELGRKSTTKIGKNGKNKLAMFRFNPGQNKKVFPPNNAYTKVVGADKVKETFNKQDYEVLYKNKDFIYELEKVKDNEKIKELYPQLDIEKKASVLMYTDHHYKEINKFNRGVNINFNKNIGESKEYYKAITRTINKTLDEIPDRFKGTVFRGAKLGQEDIEVYKKSFETGKPHIEKSFMSTSYDEEQKFSGNAYFKVNVKNGAMIEKLSKFGKEKEVLFKTGQKFRIINYQYDKEKNICFIEMEEI